MTGEYQRIFDKIRRGEVALSVDEMLWFAWKSGVAVTRLDLEGILVELGRLIGRGITINWAQVAGSNALLAVPGVTTSAGGAPGTFTEVFATTLGSAAWGDNISPASFYDSVADTTWFFWQNQPGGAGTAYDVSCRTYNHTLQNLSPVVVIATNGLTDDNHGSPSAFMDADGFVFVSYGAHNSAQRTAATTYARDPAQWTAQANLGTDTSYPHWTRIGATAFLGHRINLRSFYLTTATMSAGTITFGTPLHCIDYGAGTRFYQGTHVVVGNDIHVVGIRADSGDTERRNLYYYVVETDGAGAITGIRNFDDTVTVLAASFPVDLATAEASFKIYTHPGGELWSAGPAHAFDTNGHPHVVFSKGADVNSAADILHIWHNGTAWQTEDTVATDTSEIVGGLGCTAGAAGKIEAWYYDDPTALWSAGGNFMYRKIWDAGVFGSAELIRTADGAALAAPQAVFSGKASLRTIYRAGSPDPKGYAWGDSGSFFFSETYTPINAEATAYFARLSVQPGIDEKYWIDRLFSVIKEIGIAKFDAVYDFSVGSVALGTLEADALVNLLGTSFGATNAGATFTAGTGFASNGSSTYVEIINPASATAYLQNSAHFGNVYVAVSAAIAASDSGWFDGTDGTALNPRNATDDIAFRINQAASSTAAGTFSAIGHTLANRSGSGATQLYRNAAAQTVGTNPNQTSTAVNNSPFRLGQVASASFGARTYGLTTVGGSLTAGEVSTLYNKGIFPLMHYKGLI